MWQTYMFIVCVPSLLFLIISKRMVSKPSEEGIYEVSSKSIIIIVSLLASISYFITVFILGWVFYNLTCTSACHYESFSDTFAGISILPFAGISAILCLSATLLYLSKRRNIKNYVLILFSILLFPTLAVVISNLYNSSKYNFADIPILSPSANDSELINQETFNALKKTSSLESTLIKRTYRDFTDRQYVPFNASFTVGPDTYSFIYNDNGKFVISPPNPDLSGRKLILLRNANGLGKILPVISFTSLRMYLPDVYLVNNKKMLLVESAIEDKDRVSFIIFNPESSEQEVAWHFINLTDTDGFNPFSDNNEANSNLTVGDKYVIFQNTRSIFKLDLNSDKTVIIANIKNPKACNINSFFVSDNKIIWTEIPNKTINDNYNLKCYSYGHDM